MKNYLVGFSIAVIAAALFYFFYLLPLEDKAYLEGFMDASGQIDTVLIKSKPVYTIETKTVYIEKPAEITEVNDSSIVTATSIDTTFHSNQDTIGVQATVGLTINSDLKIPPIAEWFFELKHKDLEAIPDTVKIYVPKLVEEVVKETNWLYIIISFLIGLGLPFII